MTRILVAVALLSLLAEPARALTYSAPVKVAGASDVLLVNASATTILTYTPNTAGNYRAAIYFRVSTATTNVTLSVSWTDNTGAQTLTIMSVAPMAVGSYVVPPVFLNAASGSAISVSATAGTGNQLNVSANLTFGGL